MPGKRRGWTALFRKMHSLLLTYRVVKHLIPGDVPIEIQQMLSLLEAAVELAIEYDRTHAGGDYTIESEGGA